MEETTVEQPIETSEIDSKEIFDIPEGNQTNEIPIKETSFEVNGHKYQINETQLKQLYGLDPNEELTPKEFKTMVSAYKSQKTADLKSQDASKHQKIISELSSLIQNNPWELLQRAGYNPRELAEQYLYEQLQEEMLPESERELKKYKMELESLKKSQEESERQREEQELQQLIQYEQQNLSNQIIDALESSPLPRTPEIVQRIAKYMLLGEQKGLPITVKQVLPLVEEDIRKYNEQILRSLDPQKRMSYIGEDLLKEIRKQDLDRVKQIPSNGSAKSVQSKPSNQKLTKEEWRRQLAERVKG